ARLPAGTSATMTVDVPSVFQSLQSPAQPSKKTTFPTAISSPIPKLVTGVVVIPSLFHNAKFFRKKNVPATSVSTDEHESAPGSRSVTRVAPLPSLLQSAVPLVMGSYALKNTALPTLVSSQGSESGRPG